MSSSSGRKSAITPACCRASMFCEGGRRKRWLAGAGATYCESPPREAHLWPAGHLGHGRHKGHPLFLRGAEKRNVTQGPWERNPAGEPINFHNIKA